MELMNALPILNEIKHALERLCEHGENRTINLMNFPLTDDDAKFLDETLGRGSVTIHYDGLELSFWQESKIAGVWWGEHRNAAGRVSLRTIEIAEFPMLAKSQPEDIAQDIDRLEEMLARQSSGASRSLPVLNTIENPLSKSESEIGIR
jgi:hydrogenase-1 operon protein HyaF